MTSIVAGHVYVYHCNWIKPPHDKIVICICEKRSWFIWFNSKAAFHNMGQLPITSADHPKAISKDCFLDLSSIKGMSSEELAYAASNDRGPISDELKKKIADFLINPISVLPEVHREVILSIVK